MGSDDGADCFVHTGETDRALKNRQYRKAVAGYTKAIEWTDKTCEGKIGLNDLMMWGHYRGRAQAYVGLGDHVKAAQDIVKMIKKASHRFDDKRYDWAVVALDAAIERQPGNPSFRGGRAVIYRIKKDLPRALAEQNTQLELSRSKAERAEALAGRHWTHVVLKEPDRALADISEAIELDPKADYYAQRYRFYLPKQPKLALEDLSRVIAWSLSIFAMSSGRSFTKGSVTHGLQSTTLPKPSR